MMDTALRDRVMTLYNADLEYSAIGIEVGLTKNQVAGIVNRAKKAGCAVTRTKAPPVSLVPGWKPQPQPKPDAPAPALGITIVQSRAKPGIKPAAAPAIPAPRPLIDTIGGRCRYPIGDPREPGFHFCGAERRPGSSYCPEHHALCWRIVPAREATANPAGMAAADLSRARPAS